MLTVAPVLYSRIRFDGISETAGKNPDYKNFKFGIDCGVSGYVTTVSTINTSQLAILLGNYQVGDIFWASIDAQLNDYKGRHNVKYRYVEPVVSLPEVS